MIKIVSDSACELSKVQADELGVEITPLIVTVSQKSYRENEEITDIQLLKMIEEGATPSSSQPSIGEKMDLYNRLIAEGYQVLDIITADGLSGTYQSACMAKDACDNPDQVTVFNTRTLCVPQYVLVTKAAKMAQDGASLDEILAFLEKACATSHSFLIPIDFDFLLRGGRTSNASAFLGGLLKLIPVIRANDQGTKLEKYTIVRTYKKAFAQMLAYLKDHQVDENYTICLAHAHNQELVDKGIEWIKKEYPNNPIIVLPLTPVLIAQGGPGCVALQTINVKF